MGGRPSAAKGRALLRGIDGLLAIDTASLFLPSLFLLLAFARDVVRNEPTGV